MRTNVIYTDTRYKVDGDSVTCTIDAVLDLKKFTRKFDFLSIPKVKEFIKKNFPEVDDDYVVRITRSSTAKPIDNDVFDESLGRKIAETNAQARVFRGYSRILSQIIDFASYFIFNDADTSLFKLDFAMDSCIKHYVNLGNVDIENYYPRFVF